MATTSSPSATATSGRARTGTICTFGRAGAEIAPDRTAGVDRVASAILIHSRPACRGHPISRHHAIWSKYIAVPSSGATLRGPRKPRVQFRKIDQARHPRSRYAAAMDTPLGRDRLREFLDPTGGLGGRHSGRPYEMFRGSRG